MVTLALILGCSLFAAIFYIWWMNRRYAKDIIRYKNSEQREQTSNYVLELLARGAPLASILEAIIHGLEQQNEALYCSIQILNSEGKRLFIGAAPRLPDFFTDALNGSEVGVGLGSCGTAAFTGQRVIVEDVRAHPYWAIYQDVAAKAGLVSSWSEPIRSVTGKVLGTIAIYHRHMHQPDAQEINIVGQAAHLAEIALGRRYADHSLKEKEGLLSDILENVSAYIYMKDTQGRYLFANKLLRERFSAPMEEIVGYDDSKFFDADTAAKIHADDLRVLENGERLEAEETNLNILTNMTHVFMTVKLPLARDDGSIYALCGISTDITERKDIEEHMQHMAQYDGLTHLPNRALFNDRLRLGMAFAQRNRKKMALMFIDLDKFKPVNDTYGHGVGDLLLKDVAQRIQDCLRDSDTAARIGGDEFVILLPTIESEKDASMVGKKVLFAMNQPFELGENTVSISASIGVAVYPDHGAEEEILVNSADVAMYHAKKNGRDNVRMYESGLQGISE